MCVRGGCDFGLDGAQQVGHFCSPLLVVSLVNEEQFAQMMGVAERMLAVAKLEVGGPVVMDSNPPIAGQDGSLHADLTPFGMGMVVGQLGCAGHMQPLQPLLDTQPTLIKIDDRGCADLLLDAHPTRPGLNHELTIGGDHDRFRGPLAVEIGQQLCGARQGNEVIAVQIAGLRFQTQAILGGLGHVRRKRTLHLHATARTLLELRPDVP